MGKLGLESERVNMADFWRMDVQKLANGYTVQSGIGLTRATYVPDLPGVLRHIAYAIGGADAVPLYPVSAEEAGLVDPNQGILELAEEERSKDDGHQ